MKKIAAVLGIFALALVLSLPIAFAESDDSVSNKKVEALKKVEQIFENKIEMKSSNKGPSATIKQNGEFQVTGVKVNSVNAAGNSLNVSLYGFSRDVNVGSARLIGAGRDITLSDFRAGDILSASGKFNEATRSIQVEKIHNVSYNGVDRSKIESRIAELLKMIEDLKKKLDSLR